MGAGTAEGTGTGALVAEGTGLGVRTAVADGAGTGVLTPDGTGAAIQPGRAAGRVGDGDGKGWREPAADGTGEGLAQPAPPAAGCVPAECLTAECAEAECAEAESSRAGWLAPPDATASPTPPASKAAAGSPSQANVRVPGVLMLTSSSGRPGWPAVAVGTCGRPVRLHDHRVRYVTSWSRPGRPETAYGERT